MGGLTRGGRNIAWIEKHLFVPEGKFVGQPFKMRPFQKDWCRQIYDNPAGTRYAIITIGKKNAKTTFAACLLILHLVGPEARKNSQLRSTAQSREQAAVVYALAAKMIEMSPTLRDHVLPTDSAKILRCKALGTEYKALSAEASTAHGMSSVFAIHDELGQVRGPKFPLFTAVDNAMGAHDNPMAVIISTQAPTDNDFLSRLIDDAQEGRDPSTVLIMHTADEDLDPFSLKAIKQANPAFGDFLSKKEVLRQAQRAKRMPVEEAEYRNYILNQRVEADDPLIPRSVWEANGGKPGAGRIWYGGLDLSETNDLTAFVMVSPGTEWPVDPIFWLPKEGLAERSRKDRTPYDLWHKQGFLKTTPGRSVEYEYVADYLAGLFAKKNIKKIAFDRWNMRHLKPWLVKAGLSESFIEDRFVDFGQGYKSMGPATRNFESLLLSEKLRHGMHPILTMCAANARPEVDPTGARKPSKKKSTGRIDGIVALIMACSVASEEGHNAPVYPVKLDSILENLTA